MFDWKKPLKTKDGRGARLLGILDSLSNPIYTHVVAVKSEEGDETVQRYTPHGTFYSDEGNRLDLVNTETMFVNVYFDGELQKACCYDSRESAGRVDIPGRFTFELSSDGSAKFVSKSES